MNRGFYLLPDGTYWPAARIPAHPTEHDTVRAHAQAIPEVEPMPPPDVEATEAARRIIEGYRIESVPTGEML
jgi:hypothetical protein